MTAGKSRARAEGRRYRGDFPDMEQRVPGRAMIVAAPQATTRSRGLPAPSEEGSSDEQEHQPDVADEVLVERARSWSRRGPRSTSPPGRDEHERAVGDTPRHRSAPPSQRQSRFSIGVLLGGPARGGTFASHQSKVVAPIRAPAPGMSDASVSWSPKYGASSSPMTVRGSPS